MEGFKLSLNTSTDMRVHNINKTVGEGSVGGNKCSNSPAKEEEEDY